VHERIDALAFTRAWRKLIGVSAHAGRFDQGKAINIGIARRGRSFGAVRPCAGGPLPAAAARTPRNSRRFMSLFLSLDPPTQPSPRQVARFASARKRLTDPTRPDCRRPCAQHIHHVCTHKFGVL
jgi:hypothetical protein